MGRWRALLEVGVLGAAVNATTLVWVGWTDVLLAVGRASMLGACCIVAFYYNDLYDLRIVRTFRDFASRLPQTFGVTFILMAPLYAWVPELKTPNGAFVLGPLERLDKILKDTTPDRIILAMAERRARLPVHQLLEARVNGSIVEDGVDAYERFTGKVAIESLTPSKLIFSNDFRKSRLDLVVGRLASLLVAVVGLIVFSPLLALIPLAIKLDSKGPLFFVQERLGMHSKCFRLVKFRTMRVAENPTSEWVLDNCDRITRVGKWLRKFRLDELPQFVNVIRGDMNLVGPRPHPVTNVELFGEEIPYYFLRLAVRPGVTGWAQVRYGYANNLQ